MNALVYSLTRVFIWELFYLLLLLWFATLPRFFLDTRSGEEPPKTMPEWVAFIVEIIFDDAKSGVEVEDIILVSRTLGWWPTCWCCPLALVPASIFINKQHSLEMRGLYSMKCSSKTLQNLLYFMYYKKMMTNVIIFSFCKTLDFILWCPCLCYQRPGNSWGKNLKLHEMKKVKKHCVFLYIKQEYKFSFNM